MRIIPDDVKECICGKLYPMPCYHKSDTIEITDIKYRPDNWPEFVKYFEDRPEHWPLTEREMWEFGATSMLNALISLAGETK